MTVPAEMRGKVSDAPRQSRGRPRRGALMLVMGCLAIGAPCFAGAVGVSMAGALLTACGILERLETFHTAGDARRRSTYLSGILSVTAGLLLLAQPQLI